MVKRSYLHKALSGGGLTQEEETEEHKQRDGFAWSVFSSNTKEGTVWQHVPNVPLEPAAVPISPQSCAEVFTRAMQRIEEGEAFAIPLDFQEASTRQSAHKRNKVKSWDGASGPSRQPNPEEGHYRCDFCV